MKTSFTILLIFLFSQAFAQSNSNATILSKHKLADSLNVAKIEIVNNSFDKLVSKITEDKKDSNSIWNTLIPLLIGAALTLFAQFAIENWKTKKETKNKKIELISKGQAKVYLIVQILKDLAMYKVHKQYYLRGSQIETDGADSFKKHYEKGEQQRATESKLDDNIAEYFQIVTEYAIVTKNFDHFQEHFNKIFMYDHPRSSNFSELNTQKDLISGLQSEELRLNLEYKNFVGLFEAIQNEMK